jgi:O-methyltransferase
MTPEKRYLELLKEALTFSLWEQPPLPITAMNYVRSPARRAIVSGLERLLRRKGIGLVQYFRTGPWELVEATHWYSDSMNTMERMDSLQECVEIVLRDRVPGDLIETGVWRGGACILMRGVLAAYQVTDRRVFVADSFEGLPAPDHPKDKGGGLHTVPFLAVSLETVKWNFERYGLYDSQVVFLKGWFKDTLPVAPISSLAVLRLDGDMYASTTDSLSNLYPKLSPGGFCIIDDYDLAPCRAAVDEYRSKHGITSPITWADWGCIHWRKV